MKKANLITWEQGIDPSRHSYDKTNYYRVIEHQEAQTIIEVNNNTTIVRGSEDQREAIMEAQEVANYLEATIKAYKPNFYTTNKNVWISSIADGILKQGRSKMELIHCIDHVFNNSDGYWKPIIKDGKSLLKHFDTIESQAVESAKKRDPLGAVIEDLDRERLKRINNDK